MTNHKSPITQSPYLLLANIGQLVTVRGGSSPRRGNALKEIGIITDAAVLCAGGKIVAAGRQREILRDPWLKRHKRKLCEIDCQGRVALPGLVDSHTHPVFAAPRLVDFAKRIAGASYQEIAAAGGGIRSSVAAVRKATCLELSKEVLRALNNMMAHGTTTVEAKSGYGLSSKDEIKSLQAIHDAAAQWPGTVAATLLAAHVVPPEFAGKDDQYIETVCNDIIPKAARAKLASFVDVFCERGAFTLAQSEKVFAAARQHGLDTRAHVCQFTASKLETLLSFQPASLDHMDCVAPEEITALAGNETVATLLPGANYFLGHGGYPDARHLIDSGVAVALATDYNPGTSPTLSMPFVMSLACTHMKMSPEEAIAACTINAACALRLQGRKGSIEPGKDADLAVFDVEDYREIPYWFAWNRCSKVIIAGQHAWSSTA
ncbi:MAG: imidazolonepropionase [Candidatus Angelobacter sp. Gp1-AA117]|nr:MAG: imidazolonepropionase [Candidatus Angelobacter sp. Gp1-AA117]